MSRAKWEPEEHAARPGRVIHALGAHAEAVPDPDGGWHWIAFYCDLADHAEGWAATLDEAKAAAEAAIRSHARRLLDLVGEEP